jgi:hypothetical protein
MASRFALSAKLFVSPLLTSLGDGCIDAYVHASAEQGVRYEIRFLGNESPTFGDTIELSVIGPLDQSDEVALRAALICTIAAICYEHVMLIGDYSYCKMVASHKLFMRVQNRLNMVASDFRNAKNGALGFLRSLNEFMVGSLVVPDLVLFMSNKHSCLADSELLQMKLT